MGRNLSEAFFELSEILELYLGRNIEKNIEVEPNYNLFASRCNCCLRILVILQNVETEGLSQKLLLRPSNW